MSILESPLADLLKALGRGLAHFLYLVMVGLNIVVCSSAW